MRTRSYEEHVVHGKRGTQMIPRNLIKVQIFLDKRASNYDSPFSFGVCPSSSPPFSSLPSSVIAPAIASPLLTENNSTRRLRIRSFAVAHRLKGILVYLKL